MPARPPCLGRLRQACRSPVLLVQLSPTPPSPLEMEQRAQRRGGKPEDNAQSLPLRSRWWKKGNPGSACTWLLTPLQMLQLPSPRRRGGVGGKCGLPQEWGEGYENHGGWDLLSSSVSRLSLLGNHVPPWPALCRCDIKGLTLSQHLPAQRDRCPTPPPRCSLSCPGEFSRTAWATQ